MPKTTAPQPPANPPSPQQGGAYRLNAKNELEPLTETPQPAGTAAAPENAVAPATKE